MGRAPAYHTAPCSSRTLTKPVCEALCLYHRKHPSSLTSLREWLLHTFKVDVGLIEIHRIIERSPQFLPDKMTAKDESESESEDETEDEAEGDQNGVEVTLSDPDVLDCPICLDLLTVPVYQCENGHVACSSCCIKMQDKCPSCTQPMHSRCRIIEKVVEAASISCKYRKYGCQHTSRCGRKEEHGKTCVFSPCECPEPSCYFMTSSPKLYSHFSSCHEFSRQGVSLGQYISVTLEKGQRYLVLGAQGRSMFVLSNHSSQIKVFEIAPPHTSGRFSYDVRAKYEEAFVALHSSVESISKWRADHRPGDKFLQVPHYCFASNGQLHLELRIKSKP